MKRARGGLCLPGLGSPKPRGEGRMPTTRARPAWPPGGAGLRLSLALLLGSNRGSGRTGLATRRPRRRWAGLAGRLGAPSRGALLLLALGAAGWARAIREEPSPADGGRMIGFDMKMPGEGKRAATGLRLGADPPPFPHPQTGPCGKFFTAPGSRAAASCRTGFTPSKFLTRPQLRC